MSRSDWRVGIHLGDFLLGSGHHTLCRVRQEPDELEQHLARWVERHRHSDLANVVNARSTFDLGDLRHLNVLRLSGDFRALDLEHRGGVVNVRSIEQCTQTTSDSGRKPTDKLRQSDRVRATPRDELELDHPVELRHRFVALFPVPVHTDDFRVVLVDHQNVGSQFAFRVRIILFGDVRVDVVHTTQSIGVVTPLLTLDLVIRLLG